MASRAFRKTFPIIKAGYILCFNLETRDLSVANPKGINGNKVLFSDGNDKMRADFLNDKASFMQYVWTLANVLGLICKEIKLSGPHSVGAVFSRRN